MLLEFAIIFLIVFIFNYLFNYIHMRKNDKILENKALSYVILKYKLKMNESRIKILSKTIIVINTVIISIPIEIILRCNLDYLLVICISFISFIILMLISYNILGVILKKKGW